MLIFPIRHHSPAASAQLERVIRERRPRAVLIEGPIEAEPVIPFLIDRETMPPVAVYAYRSDLRAGSDAPGSARAAMFPFCAYSPELVALRTGYEVGAALRFCDVPAAVSLSWPEEDEHDDPTGLGWAAAGTDRNDAGGSYGMFTERLAAEAGFDSFDAFWEAVFEQEAGAEPLDRFVASLTAFGTIARSYATISGAHDDTRERHMAGIAREVIAGGIPDDDVILVCGAAHVAAIEHYVATGEDRPVFTDVIPVDIAVIPFSYPRLSEQHGYGAGNRAPWFYQQVWNLGGDYTAATRRTFVALGHRLRAAGLVASLAQSIDADRLARTLAGMRGKVAPGVDEVRDAAVACFGQGRESVVAEALREILIGKEVGRVTFWAGRTPLQVEFYDTTTRLKLPVQDAPREILVHLPMPDEAAQSVFLHRLITAEIPFARELASGIGSGGRAAAGGPLEQLGRAREKWELCWRPATDTRLVELNAWGSTLAEVCSRTLRQRLGAATRIDEGSEILLSLALCDLPEPFGSALARCEGLAADSGSFPSLARAAYHLDGLLGYGAARRLPVEELTRLAERLFARAALHLPAAAVCGDDAAAEVEATLRPLAELVQRSRPGIPAELFWESVAAVAALETAHPGVRGLCLTLLEVGGKLEPGELARRLRFALSLATDPSANARLVAGMFSLHRGTLVRNRAVVGAVSSFLTSMDVSALVPLLPALRRSLGDLTRGERTYLEETLAHVVGADGAVDGVVFTVTERERERLIAADAAVMETLRRWEERYGIA